VLEAYLFAVREGSSPPEARQAAHLVWGGLFSGLQTASLLTWVEPI
jgi:hypothetical protein